MIFLRQQQYQPQMQKQAQWGLDHQLMSKDKGGVFNSFDAFTSQTSILRKGFPMVWKPCTLSRYFVQQKMLQPSSSSQQQLPKIRLVLIGGSSSCISPKSCETDPRHVSYKSPQKQGQNVVLNGRYSNILQQSLDQDMAQFAQLYNARDTNHTNNNHTQVTNLEILNMGQGSQDSGGVALLLDSKVNPITTDILVIDFSLNDGFYKGPEMMAKRMQLLLARIEALFRNHSQKVPPIMIVYLWNAAAGGQKLTPGGNITKQQLLEEFFMADAWKHQKSLLERYRNQHGWDIQVLNVGAVIHTALLQLPDNKLRWQLFLEDGTHPNCAGNHLIAAMVQHALYTNMAAATTSCSTSTAATSLPMPVGENKTTTNTTTSHNNNGPLMHDLLHPNITVKTFSHWKPSQGFGRLQLKATSDNKQNDVVSTSWVAYNREDRKQGLVVPKCASESSSSSSDGSSNNNSTTKSSMMMVMRQLVLQENSSLQWKWLGLHFAGGTAAANMVTWIIPNITMYLNNEPVKLKYQETTLGTTNYVGWVQVPKVDRTTTTTTNIALCHVCPAKMTVAMNYVVAVMEEESL